MTDQPQPVIFSTDDYLIPQWGALPQYEFFFQIIKGGSIIGSIPIKKKQFSLIGRLDDLCDIFVDNPTVSRKHAILQFKREDPLPLLFDLGSAQGTYVNNIKLPPKVYQKLQLCVNLKFGVSSRCYVLRCPQLEQLQNEQEEEKQNEFMKTLSQQNKVQSKQEIKKKYLQLLKNDPYHGGQLKSRKFEGQSKKTNDAGSINDGISWGISDQTEVYTYSNEKQFPIEPDMLRRLPGLDQTMLQKLADYEEKFRIYDQIQSELNQLSNKEKRQYGLEQKLQNKKQKLEKKFVQSLEALEKCEDWIRVHIFGDESSSQNKNIKQKFKQIDTFSDDEFYDRTLQGKKNKNNEISQTKGNAQKISQPTVEDLWMIKSSFIAELARKKELLDQYNSRSEQKGESIKETEQQDELQMFMKQNDVNLNEENENIFNRESKEIEQRLKELKQKLSQFLTIKEINKIQTQILTPQKIRQKQDKKERKSEEERQKLCSTLETLQREDKMRRQRQKKREMLEKVDEYSQKIFQFYKEEIEEQQMDEQQRQFKSRYYDQDEIQYQRPGKRVHQNEEQSVNIIRDQRGNVSNGQIDNESQLSQEKVFDITKNFM